MMKLNAAKGILALGMSACLLTACGSTPASQSNVSKTSGMEGNTGAQTSEVEKGTGNEKGAGQLMWQDKEGKWQFDISQFDASKFSGKLYIDDKEIALPMTVNSLLEQEIYVHESVSGTLEDTLSEMQEKEMESGDCQNKGWVWHNVNGSMKSIEGIHQCTIWNPLQENVPIKECAVGTMMFTPDHEGVPIMGFEEPEESPYRLSLEEVVNMLGVPCYYNNGSDGSMYYYYGDYSLYFSYNSSGSIITCTYLTTAYAEGPLWLDPEGWAEYKEVYDRINP